MRSVTVSMDAANEVVDGGYPDNLSIVLHYHQYVSHIRLDSESFHPTLG